MSERKYYCFCGSNCKYETMTKEQILAAITQAVETGSVGDCDTGFVTKLKEQNAGNYVTFWVGTQAQYNAIETKATNCLYILTDDTTKEDFEKFADDIRRTADEAISTANTARSTANEAANTAQEASNIANEALTKANTALTNAGIKREFTIKKTNDTGDEEMSYSSNAAWFYIIEVMDSTGTSSVYSRETMALDYYSLISENTYEFACGAKICGYLSGKKVTVMILNPNDTKFRLSRFVGYM